MEIIDRSALLPYSTDEMFALVSDIEAYPQFLPWCSGAQVLSREGDELSARIAFSVRGVSKSFTTRNRLQPGAEIYMQACRGSVQSTRGTLAI